MSRSPGGTVLVDAHAHLNGYPDDRLDGVLATIEERSILTMAVSVDPATFARTKAIAARSPLVIPGFGIHPWQAPRFADRLDEITELSVRSPMIGEIGLDRRWVESTADRGPQQVVFEHQLELACRQDKTVNIHTAGAETEVVAALRRHRPPRVIVHWYSGPDGPLDELIALGCRFTVGVEMLVSDRIREIATRIPSDRLLTETDNPSGWPWLAGSDDPGRPELVEPVVAEIARVRGTDPATVARLVAGNMARLLAGDPHLRRWEPLADKRCTG